MHTYTNKNAIIMGMTLNLLKFFFKLFIDLSTVTIIS